MRAVVLQHAGFRVSRRVIKVIDAQVNARGQAPGAASPAADAREEGWRAPDPPRRGPRPARSLPPFFIQVGGRGVPPSTTILRAWNGALSTAVALLAKLGDQLSPCDHAPRCCVPPPSARRAPS